MTPTLKFMVKMLVLGIVMQICFFYAGAKWLENWQDRAVIAQSKVDDMKAAQYAKYFQNPERADLIANITPEQNAIIQRWNGIKL